MLFRSVAAVSVAAHEVGHAIQDATGYGFLRMRHNMYPITNFASQLSVPMIIAGAIFSQTLVTVGIVLFAGNYVVPEGEEGSLYLDGRSSNTGTLTGAGTFNIYTSYVRGDLNGNWSNFTGTINTFSSTRGVADIRFGNATYGWNKATLNVGNNL